MRMTWRYQLLQKAQDVFDKHAAAQAPGSTLTFGLPKLDPTQANNRADIVYGDKRIALPMVSNTTFALVRDAEAAANEHIVQ